MKKLSISLLLITISFALHAQKLFSTNTGQIKFNASTALENVKAVNNQVESKMLDKTGQIVFSVLIKSFRFENQLMEDHFNENYLESTRFPKAEFKGYITNISTVDFLKDGAYPISLDGTLTIHGVSRKITANGIMNITGGKPDISGSFKINMKDYGVSGLYIGEKIASEPEIIVNCKYE